MAGINTSFEPDEAPVGGVVVPMLAIGFGDIIGKLPELSNPFMARF